MKSSKFNRSEIFTMAHSFVKKYGVSLSEALTIAWRNAKLRIALNLAIVHFYFMKADGTLREAWGTLVSDKIPATSGENNRKKNDNVQVYFDTEKSEWRSFKKINLVKIA